ncbi:uncharacterized protein [Danio rerio]|uniref:Uncharacterized protein n=1 Tax=Danio rerio TaxID=7955 RepID=A0AC58HEA4_DANRE
MDNGSNSDPRDQRAEAKTKRLWPQHVTVTKRNIRVHYRAPFKHCSRERCHGNGATTRHLTVNSTSLMRQFSLISGLTKLPLQQKKRAKMKGANHRAGGNTDFGSSSTHSTTLFFLARLHSRIRKKPATRETAEGSLKDIFIRIC